jgi:hypothetical protein
MDRVERALGGQGELQAPEARLVENLGGSEEAG